MSQLNWSFFPQVVTDRDVALRNAGNVSAVSFDKTGDHLAFGTEKGTLTVLRKYAGYGEYYWLHSWEAHVASFDTLRSTVVSSKVQALEWLRQSGSTPRFLSANEKEIFLWQLNEDPIKLYSPDSSSSSTLSVPSVEVLARKKNSHRKKAHL